MSLEAREFQCGAESLPAAASLAALAAVLAATQRATDAEALVRRCLKIRHAYTVLSPLWDFRTCACLHMAMMPAQQLISWQS